MKRIFFFILASGLWLLNSAYGQTPISTDRLTAQSVEIVTPALARVSQVSAFVVGNSGPATYYYWIVARYPQGNASPSPYALISRGPNALSGSNYIRLNWGAVPGATSYDVLRTTTSQLPNGAASIAVATAVAATTRDDTGGALASYTINTLQPGRVSLRFIYPFENFLASTPPPVSATNEARFYYDLATQQMMMSVNGGAYFPFGVGAGAGITSINGLSSQAQFLSTCTTGLDFNIQDDIDTHSLCIPDASATARGLVTTGAQVLGGNKTFTGDTLMDGDLYVTGFFSTDHPIEGTIADACVASEASTYLLCVDPDTLKLTVSIDGADPSEVGAGGGTIVQTIGNGLISGGGVAWTGNLNFTVSAAEYLIAGNSYTSPQTDITLTAADAVNPRIDAIIVNDAGAVTFITGTPAATPALPSVDATSQLLLTFVYVAALATTPANFTNVDIYLENTEWTCTASANFNCASTNNPFAGTKDIEATTAVAGNNVTLTKPAAGTENLSNYNTISFRIRSKATWPGPKALVFTWFNGTTQVGLPVALKNNTFGFDASITASYQLVVLPVSLFNTGQNLVTTLKAAVAGGGGSIGFYIDNVLLQGGANGGESGTVRFADQIVPTGAINGVNTVYTLPQVPNPSTSAVCVLNGLSGLQSASADYTVSLSTVTYINAPLTGDRLWCSYRY